jgi:cytidylate kinase
MAAEKTLDHLVERACREWERHKHQEARASGPAGPARPFTVALGREAGAGASVIAEELGRRLGWAVYDRDLVERIAREWGLRTSLVESVDERRMSWFKESVQGFVSALAEVPPVTESAYVQHLVETVLALGSHGECIIVGRGCAHILPPETALRVRLVAPFAFRVARAAHKRGLDPKAVTQLVHQLDRERTRFVRDHFFKDPEDPRNFDLVLNTSRMPFGDCADLILDALRRMRVRAASGGAP